MPNNLNEILPSLALPRVAQSLDNTCGAACFDSMFSYFRGHSPGEIHFANELDTLRLGYTPPINIVKLAKKYGFACQMTEHAVFTDLIASLIKKHVLFVTWWDEDAGHYSLVKHIDHSHITLMDPWLARLNLDNQLAINDFIVHWQARDSRIIAVHS